MHVFFNKFVARFPCHPPLRPFEGWESHKTLITKKRKENNYEQENFSFDICCWLSRVG